MSAYEVLQLELSFESQFYASEAWTIRKSIIESEIIRNNAFIKIGNEIINLLNSKR